MKNLTAKAVRWDGSEPIDVREGSFSVKKNGRAKFAFKLTRPDLPGMNLFVKGHGQKKHWMFEGNVAAIVISHQNRVFKINVFSRSFFKISEF